MQHEPSESMDVLIFLGAFQLRGSYTRSIALTEQLVAQRFGLKIIATECMRELPKGMKKTDVRVSRNLHRRLIGTISRRFLASDFRATPPSIIDIQHRGLHPVGSWLARRLRRPYVVTIHDYLRDRERFVIDPNWCRRVVAISESVRSELLDRTNLPEEMVVVIPSGVVPPPESDLLQVLASHRAPVIGTAGPLEPGKGLRHFLKAASQVLQTHPQAMFLIAGSGPEERMLRRMTSELQMSHAVSIVSNLHGFDEALRAMDIFVLPSLKQGLASIMLNAMARGLPVIATESGGVFSVVLDGVTGLLIPPSNEEALAERMRNLLDNPDRARELGAAARQRVIEHFHLDQMISATIKLYREIANQEA